MQAHTQWVTHLANLLTGSCAEWIDAGGAWQQWIVGICRESNESPPDGLLPGIATHCSPAVAVATAALDGRLLYFPVCECVCARKPVCLFQS